MAVTKKWALINPQKGYVYLIMPKHEASWYPKTELQRGIKVEMEHTTSKWLARMIAKNHLDEDRKYYTKLAKMHKD